MGHSYHNYNTEQCYPVLSFQFELNSFSPLVVCLYQCFFFQFSREMRHCYAAMHHLLLLSSFSRHI